MESWEEGSDGEVWASAQALVANRVSAQSQLKSLQSPQETDPR